MKAETVSKFNDQRNADIGFHRCHRYVVLKTAQINSAYETLSIEESYLESHILTVPSNEEEMNE